MVSTSHVGRLRSLHVRFTVGRRFPCAGKLLSSAVPFVSGDVWSLPLDDLLFRATCTSALSLLRLPDECWVLLQVLSTQYSNLSQAMKGRERWSLLDWVVLRRRRSVQVAIDQFLDQLVDIFDFPLTPPSYDAGSLSVPSPSKGPAANVYTTMDEAMSRSRECTVGSCPNRPRRVSMADRVRELLLRSSRSKTSTRNSVAICNSTKSNNSSEARTLQMSWLSGEWKAPTEPQDELWIERDEQDRQLQCGYQTLADEGSI